MAACTLIYAVIWVLFSVHRSFAVTHTLQYFHTVVTAGLHFPEYTDVGVVDGEQFVYYDSNIRKYIPKTEWINKISDDDPLYWISGTHNQQSEQETYKVNMATMMQRFNHSTGVHTLQRMYGCEIDDDDGTIRGYDQLGYDGEDFISLDLKTATWTAAKPEAVLSKHKLDNTESTAYDKFYLENICVEWLKKYVSYGREILMRKVPPEVSVFQKHSRPELVCHVTGFYPKEVTITWQKDGEDLIEDVELRETLPNHDGSFQKRSIVKVPAEETQTHTYTCVVQHSSLEEEMAVKHEIIRKGRRSDVVRIGVNAAVLCGIAVVGYLIMKKEKSDQVSQNVVTSELLLRQQYSKSRPTGVQSDEGQGVV